MREKVLKINDGVAVENGNCWNILDNLDYFRKKIENAGEIREKTPDNTDADEWQKLCAMLDLGEANDVRRIFEALDMGTVMLMFADENDYDF